MSAVRPGLVDIAREFFEAHRLMRRVLARHREGSLRFEELTALVGDDEQSVLFRLKERCHLAFRNGADGSLPLHREALFDLAVGSLFHEAMKFREDFYQHEVYGPRVEALRSDADAEETALFEEFARIQEGVAARLDEGLTECEALLEGTVDQLVGLLAAHHDDALVARFLVQSGGAVEETLDRSLESALDAIYGDAATGYAHAGRSLLDSGYYPEAIRALNAASEHGAAAPEISRLVAYARGMQAYLARDYGETVAKLSEWADAPGDAATELTMLARDAVARIGQLATGSDRERIRGDAATLLARLGPPG